MSLLTFEWMAGRRREPGATPLLEVQEVSVRLGQRLVLDSVSLEIYEGDQVRIAGPNGAGKSTLLNAIMGVEPLVSGRIQFRGEDITGLPAYERARRGIRYMRQRENVFPSLTVNENLQVALGKGGYSRFREAFPEWASDIVPHIMAGMLSGGQKQKLAWGLMALQESSMFLADEPTAGVSMQDARQMSNLRTALWISHDHK